MLREFVELAEKRAETFARLCARFGISRKTGYKWLRRFRMAGDVGLKPLSRRPRASPTRTPRAVVEVVLALRRAQPTWSAARIREELLQQEMNPIPAASTIDLILRRQREAAQLQRNLLGIETQRFEPNYRWLLRRAGEVRLGDGSVVVPIVVQDQCTEFVVGVAALSGRREQALKGFVTELLKRHGLPWRLQLTAHPELRRLPPCRVHTNLSVWLMRLGVQVEFDYANASASRPERPAELAARLAELPSYQHSALADRATPSLLDEFAAAARRLTLESAPAELERLREAHNFAGQHEAMQRRSPISLFRPSERLLPAEPPLPAYDVDADVRLVSEKGMFTFHRRLVHVGRPFAGLPVELKLTPHPQRFIVVFAGQLLGMLNLAAAEKDHTTSLVLSAD